MLPKRRRRFALPAQSILCNRSLRLSFCRRGYRRVLNYFSFPSVCWSALKFGKSFGVGVCSLY